MESHIRSSKLPGIGYEYCVVNYYHRVTRCDGDIVTLLWFRVSVRVSVNAIETQPLRVSSANLKNMFTVMRRCTLLIFEVIGQRSMLSLTCLEISL